MKKTLLLFLALGVASMLAAQVYFTDDFESYNEGNLIGAASDVWTTWSMDDGGSEDAPISIEQAYSGVNSLKLESTSTGGGPSDVVLPFGGAWDIGTFTFECHIYVASGKGAYFNFQAEETIGNTWALEFYFQYDGTLRFARNLEAGVYLIHIKTGDYLITKKVIYMP